jgi:cell volume regulation protein A
MRDPGLVILVAGGLMAMALGASLIATRLRVPGLLLFIGIGMLAGSDGLGVVDLSDYALARDVGIVGLSLILFEGGLAAGFRELRPVLGTGISLGVLGTLLTALIAGLAASWLFEFSTLEGLLLGSVVATTDAAAVFAVLRGSTLRRRIARTLEGEAGFNDPVALLLVVGFIDWIQLPDYGLLEMAGQFVAQLAIGLGAGLATGFLAVRAFRRLPLAAGLYPVASLTAVALAYGLADVLGGSGFLAVYLAGLTLGSTSIPARQTVGAFHDGLAWIAQLAMFLVLGLLVFPSQLPEVALEGTLMALIVAFVARPLAVVVATALSPLNARERIVIGWVGLKGALPVVFATFPVVAGVPHSLEFFNIAFFAVLLSTLIQGTTVEPLARAVGVTTEQPALPRPLTEIGTIRRLGAEVIEYPVAADDAIAGVPVRELGLPRDALINVIVRDGEALPPRGSTRIEAGDRLHILVRIESAPRLQRLLELWHTGPIGTPALRRPRISAGPQIFTVRLWTAADGDPADPQTVMRAQVVERLRSRHDMPGALVALDDGRYAVTGPVLVIGPASLVQRQARKALGRAEGAERAWWQEVIGALSV